MCEELMDGTGTKNVSRSKKRGGKFTAASDAAGEANADLTPFDYELDVDSPTNANVVNLAENVCWKKQGYLLWDISVSTIC